MTRTEAVPRSFRRFANQNSEDLLLPDVDEDDGVEGEVSTATGSEDPGQQRRGCLVEASSASSGCSSSVSDKRFGVRRPAPSPVIATLIERKNLHCDDEECQGNQEDTKPWRSAHFGQLQLA
mmetsp:Transcript_80566/g.176695  ORF Transcript_80566/g.176695 Transcript_80566/m.176695 type:complete len:122 (+) Transcript_80566:1830-2195(+)